MDDLFDLDLYFDPQLSQKPRGSAEQSTAALIASSMNSEYTYDWSQRQDQAQNHSAQAPSLVQLGTSSYRPAPNPVLSDTLSRCPPDLNGSFDLPDELCLPPLSAPTDSINFQSQYSDLINYSNLQAFGGNGNLTKNNSAVTYGNNGAIAFGSNACLELQRVDRPTDNTFMGIPIASKKEYEDAPFYTDLDIFKPLEDPPKNSDGSFLSPSVEVSNQYPPNRQVENVDDSAGSKKKGKPARKTPTKKRKGPPNEGPLLQNSQNDPSLVNDYSFSDVPNLVDGTLPFPGSTIEKAFPLFNMKPESSSLNRVKVKSPRKTPTKKKKAQIQNYSSSIDSSSLKMTLKCEKSIVTENEERSVSADTSDSCSRLTSNTTPLVNNSSVFVASEDLDRIEPADDPALENHSGLVLNESHLEGLNESDQLPVLSVPQNRPPSTSKTKLPTAKAPSYLTGFPMRCPQYPIVYCCNYCARIFTSIRGGQLHDCVKKRPGRKAVEKAMF